MNIKELLRGCINQNDLLNYYNACVIYDSLPNGINGWVFYYDSIYFIIINKNLPYYMKKNTLLHELDHIELNQLCQIDKDLFEFHISEYEDEADKYIKKIKGEINENN